MAPRATAGCRRPGVMGCMGWSWAAAHGVQGRGHIMAAARLQLVDWVTGRASGLLKKSCTSITQRLYFHSLCETQPNLDLWKKVRDLWKSPVKQNPKVVVTPKMAFIVLPAIPNCVIFLSSPQDRTLSSGDRKGI